MYLLEKLYKPGLFAWISSYISLLVTKLKCLCLLGFNVLKILSANVKAGVDWRRLSDLDDFLAVFA